MNLLDDLLNSLNTDAPVRSILVGAHWTVVCTRRCGMASTLMSPHPHGHVQVREAGDLLKKSARELAELARSDELLESSIGVAAINSLLEVDESRAVEVNASEVLAQRGRGKNVALVGHFPFIPKLRPSVGNLWVIEQNPAEGEYPAEAAADLLPRADVVALTGSALINHTLDGLLALCPKQATVLVLGPSTPLSPVLFDHGATIVSGTCVLDEEAVLRTVSQGASFQQVKGTKLITISNEAG
ncbi:MAG: Rossmann-like domain-containing protein [Chloroflexota bacterium]